MIEVIINYRFKFLGHLEFIIYILGSKFDLNGRYNNWWTNETLKTFQTQNECFVEQYSRFNVTEANRFV